MRNLLTLLIVLFTLTNLRGQVKEDKNILIIHSYHQGLEWTNNISRGIDNIFYKKSEYQLFYEYLDTKRNPSEEYMNQLYHLFEMKMSKMKFNAIIASDNAAFDFLSKYAEDLFPDIPIVFCGINNAEKLIDKLRPNMYVLGEKADHMGTLSLMSKLLPDLKNVIIINDKTLTGRMIKEEVDRVIPYFKDRFNFHFIEDFYIAELEHQVADLPANSAIYLLVINRDNKGEFISYRRGIDIVKRNTNVPIFGSWDFYLNRGILGGMITSGNKQGEEAARLALILLENKNTRNAKHLSYVASVGMIDYNELSQLRLKPDELPKDLHIINAPEEHSYKRLFFIALATLLFVVSIFLFLSYQKRHTNRMLEVMVKSKTKELKDIIEKKDKFLSLIAHDLRSPSGSVAAGMTFLINDGNTMNEGRRLSFMKELAKSANKVFSLLEDMLLWGRVQFTEGYTPKKEKVNLYPIVSEVAAVYYYDRDKSLFINNVTQEYSLHSDAFVLKFILRNLISNALKFSDTSSPITIGADTSEGYYRFWVQDEGRGMTEEIIMSIVNQKPIQTLGNLGQQSFGIGLNAVSDYLKLCGGILTIDSQIGQGTCFYVYLPIHKEVK